MDNLILSGDLEYSDMHLTVTGPCQVRGIRVISLDELYICVQLKYDL